MKPPKNFNQWMGFEPEFDPILMSPFELSNIQSALNRGSFMRMPSNGSVPTSTKKFGWGGVLSAGLGMVGNVISTAMTNRANREMQREANEQNERLWREQMEYNSPVNQMARFKQAGLNPNLAYGDNGNAGAPPEYISSRNQSPQFDPMAISNALLIKKQLDMTDAEIANINADTRQKNASSVGQENENSVFNEKFDAFMREHWSKLGLNEAEATLKFQQGQTEYQNYVAKQLENYFNSATMQDRINSVLKHNQLTDEQIKVAKATASKLFAEISYLRKQGELIDAKVFTEKAQRAYIESRTDLTEEEKQLVRNDASLKLKMTGYYDSLADKVDAETVGQRIKNTQAQSEKEFYDFTHGLDNNFGSGGVKIIAGALTTLGMLF